MFRKKPQAPRFDKARERAQVTSTQDLQYWIGSSLPVIQTKVTAEAFEEAEQYLLSVYEIVRELHRRKQTGATVGSKPFQ